MKKIMYYLVFLCFGIVNSAEICEPGHCYVSKYFTDQSQPMNRPAPPIVDISRKSVCIIKITRENGYGNLTGVLIAPDLVVTAMHGFDGSNNNGFADLDPSKVKVLFGYEGGPFPSDNDSRWIQTIDM
jgi:hypothetical protein